MKQYETYKDSGVEWIGDMPEGWIKSRIKYAGKIIGRIGYRGYTVADIVSKGNGAVALSPSNIKNQQLQLETNTYVSWEKYEESPEIKIFKNDILIVKTGSTIGKIAIVNETDEKLTLNPQLVVLKDVRINSELMYYIAISSYFQKFFDVNSAGGSTPAISQEKINNFELVYPKSPEEQTQIANYLNHKTAQLDTLIAKKEQLISLLQEERTAMINQAVTKGLDPNVPMKDSGIEWLGEIPAHWEITRIKYIGNIVSGYSFKSEDFKDEGVRVMKISNIQTMRIDWTDDSYLPNSFLEEYSRFKINKGDLVFALTRPIISTGIKASIVNENCEILLNQRNAVLKPIPKLEIQWMYYMIFNEPFKQHFESLIDSTGQQPNISSTDIGNISIPLPTKQEQIFIINYIDFKEKEINKTIDSFTKEIELLKEYKTALISEVVTGKVDVRDEVIS
jgi:type I restriction enzyme S subunit